MKKLIQLLIIWPIMLISQNALAQENRDSADIYLEQAQNQLQQGNMEAAMKSFQRTAELQPEEASHYVGRGQMLYELERYEEALEAFEISQSMDPSRVDVKGMTASALARLGRFDQALSLINESLKASPDDPGSPSRKP